jgi:hypothetical protein
MEKNYFIFSLYNINYFIKILRLEFLSFYLGAKLTLLKFLSVKTFHYYLIAVHNF